MFCYSNPKLVEEKLHNLDRNYGNFFDNDVLQSEREKKRLQSSSIMEEAIASSQIEGAVTTRVAAKQMLWSGRKPKNRSEQMIANNYAAIIELKHYKTRHLTLDLLLLIHSLVTKDTLDNPEYEGTFRINNEVNVVDVAKGEVVHIPPDYTRLSELMASLCKFANDDSYFIHPVIKASMLHFLIGYIHPFYDGNGRTARAVFYWYLLRNNYWMMEYVSISKLILKTRSQYANAYQQAEMDGNDITYFIKYQIKILEASFCDLKQYLIRKRTEKTKISELLRYSNFNHRQGEIIQKALENDLFEITIKQYASRTNVVFATARTDLMQLVSLGFFDSVKKKKTYYFFPKKNLQSHLETMLDIR